MSRQSGCFLGLRSCSRRARAEPVEALWHDGPELGSHNPMIKTDQNILDVLQARGFVQQTTDADTLRAAFSSGPVTFYIG